MALWSVVALFALHALCAAAQGVTRLRVEYLDSPLTVDTPLPRFSFARTHPLRGVTQSAYRITVTATGTSQLVWDSGVVASNASLNIEYAGLPLLSDTDYSWSAQWLDAGGVPSAPASATFSTALLEGPAVGGWGAEWVAPAPGANVLRAEFSLPAAPVRARLYISGLGYYRSFLNGQPTDAHVMGSFTTFEKRVLYDVWDVAGLLVQGCNGLGVMLGRGWYNQSSIHAGPLSLWALLSVDTADGKRSYFGTALGSSNSSSSGLAAPLALTSAPGPVVSDEIYLGEHYDARLEQRGWAGCAFANASAWLPATPTRNATQSAAFSAHTVPILPDLQLPPVSVSEPKEGLFVFDFGRNMAGIATVRAVCADGPQTIRVDYAETLQLDGTILQPYTYPYPLIMTSNFTCAGTGEVEAYTTLFSQYGFQYAQVSNYPGTPALSAMTAYTVNSAVGQGSAFQTNNALLNQVQLATRAASLSNLMGVPTDCPQRERRGWLGDAQVSFYTVAMNFDASAFYTKWLRDVADAQFEDGRLGDTAPFYNHGGLPADPAWSAAYPLLVAWCAELYSDSRLVATHYAGVRAFVEWQHAQLGADGLLPVNASQGRYGDWCGLSQGANTSCHFARVGLSSYYYIKGVQALAGFAEALGKAADAARYTALAQAAVATFHAQLWNATLGAYEDGYPVSQLAALDLGGGDAGASAGALAALVQELTTGARSGHPLAPTGGIIFQRLAYPVLSGAGRMDLALRLLLARGMPSIAYWMDSAVQTTPATTLWERWGSTATVPQGSFNHIMFGGYGGWLYSAVAGLGRAPGSTSYAALDIAPPQPLPPSLNLTSASATVDTALGLAEVSWRVGNCSTVLFELQARVPVGGQATLRLPLGSADPALCSATEAGVPVWQRGQFVPGVPGVRRAYAGQGYLSLEVGSGLDDLQLTT